MFQGGDSHKVEARPTKSLREKKREKKRVRKTHGFNQPDHTGPFGFHIGISVLQLIVIIQNFVCREHFSLGWARQWIRKESSTDWDELYTVD